MSRHLRFFFEYGVHTPLWPFGGDLDSPYGYPCELDRLPLSPGVREELARLTGAYQSSLDWDDPAGPSPWPEERKELFNQQAVAALEALVRDLGDGWTVEDEFSPFEPTAG